VNVHGFSPSEFIMLDRISQVNWVMTLAREGRPLRMLSETDHWFDCLRNDDNDNEQNVGIVAWDGDE